MGLTIILVLFSSGFIILPLLLKFLPSTTTLYTTTSTPTIIPTDIATRASMLTLLSIGKTTTKVSSLLTIPKSTIRDILSRVV